MSRYTATSIRAVSRDGRAFEVRSVGPADRAGIKGVFEQMSPESRRRRFLAVKPSLSERELTYLTDIDHVSHEALAALDDGRIVAVARYAVDRSLPCTAEVAVEVADAHQGRGLGSALVREIVERARANGLLRLRATMLWENAGARSIFKALGFRASGSSQGLLDLELALESAGCSGMHAVTASAA